MLTRDQTIILRIFAGLKAQAGRPVPVGTLFLNWAPSLGNAAFADAVEALADAGLLEAQAGGTAYSLTPAGAAHAL